MPGGFPEDAMKVSQKIHFFETPAAMRAWLEKNHLKATELQVGYYKRHAVANGTRSITGAESVAEALCFGWIDGVVTPLDADRYAKRFTPRRPGSKWSALNIRTIAELEAANRMTDAGRAVFEARKDAGSPGYKAKKKVGTLDGRASESSRGTTARGRSLRLGRPVTRRPRRGGSCMPSGKRRATVGWRPLSRSPPPGSECCRNLPAIRVLP